MTELRSILDTVAPRGSGPTGSRRTGRSWLDERSNRHRSSGAHKTGYTAAGLGASAGSVALATTWPVLAVAGTTALFQPLVFALTPFAGSIGCALGLRVRKHEDAARTGCYALAGYLVVIALNVFVVPHRFSIASVVTGDAVWGGRWFGLGLLLVELRLAPLVARWIVLRFDPSRGNRGARVAPPKLPPTQLS